MQVITNESYINRRKKIGELAPFAGLILLAASAVLIIVKPEWLWVTMAVVWLGFIVSLTGSYLGERFVGPNAHWKRVPDALKGLSRDHWLLLYQLASPYVLVEPGGLTVISVKPQGGQVTYEDGRWRHRQKLGFLRRFAGQESIGRPHRFANAEADVVRDQLAKRLPEGTEIPVRTVILFTQPDIELNVDADAVPVPTLRVATLKRWLRKNPLRPKLPAETRALLAKVLLLDGEAEVE
jgi:hypothetical protein